ncbi:MAG: hypothetical protein NT027_06150 [Proteobacteria bacterium]|nr:hypothetical protein [Pseudomonadota bacterium]
MTSQKLDFEASFYAAFDPSKIESFLQEMSQKSEQSRLQLPNFIGEGTHFQSFELQSKPMNLAINIAKQTFVKRGPRLIEKWKSALRSLKNADCKDLIPPFEVIQYIGLLAIVMPKGSPLNRKGAQAKSTFSVLEETSKSLSRMGLVLDDYPQLVECNGNIFICDWSDLQSL